MTEGSQGEGHTPKERYRRNGQANASGRKLNGERWVKCAAITYAVSYWLWPGSLSCLESTGTYGVYSNELRTDLKDRILMHASLAYILSIVESVMTKSAVIDLICLKGKFIIYFIAPLPSKKITCFLNTPSSAKQKVLVELKSRTFGCVCV